MQFKEAKTTRARQRLAALLRFCAVGAELSEKAGAGMLVALDGRQMKAGAVLVTVAQRAGLLTAGEDGSLTTTSAGRSFLRRLAAEASGLLPDQPFQAQHRDLAGESIVMDGVDTPVVRNRLESPLSALGRLKDRNGTTYIGEAELRAGERIASDFERAQMRPRITANWEASVSSGSTRTVNGQREISDSALSARIRIERAIDALGPDLSGVVLDVCCFEKGMETVERERQWPARSAKLMLRTGLGALSRHYGYSN